MRELSLFTGGAGGVLGTKLLGFQAVGYVEWEPYCQKIIQARIADGYLDAAPIFGDIRKFVSEGYADAYQGMVDVVSAGFPCQPFSTSGRQLGSDDERNMWPATRDCIRVIHPQSLLLENVPGLVSCGYIGTVITDLAALGYVGKWGIISAGATGADHERERLWIVAHPAGKRLQGQRASREPFNTTPLVYRQTSGLVDAVQRGSLPYVCREHDGVANGMDRLKAIGNGQVPIVVARAWQTLTQ